MSRVETRGAHWYMLTMLPVAGCCCFHISRRIFTCTFFSPLFSITLCWLITCGIDACCGSRKRLPKIKVNTEKVTHENNKQYAAHGVRQITGEYWESCCLQRRIPFLWIFSTNYLSSLSFEFFSNQFSLEEIA